MIVDDGLSVAFQAIRWCKQIKKIKASQRKIQDIDSQSLPGNSGLPLSISARTQPTLHISIARVYSLKVSITSGARYHLRPSD